jgi:hypothetical protein
MAMPNHNSEFSRWADRLVFCSTAARRPPFYVRVHGPNVGRRLRADVRKLLKLRA